MHVTFVNEAMRGYEPRQQSSWGQHGPTLVLSAPDGPHVGPMNLAIGESCQEEQGGHDILPDLWILFTIRKRKWWEHNYRTHGVDEQYMFVIIHHLTGFARKLYNCCVKKGVISTFINLHFHVLWRFIAVTHTPYQYLFINAAIRYRWLARLQHLLCVSNGDTAVLR